MAIKPSDMVLRCYGHKMKNGNWYGVCVDLNLYSEAASPQELEEKLKEVILSYLESVYDTEDEKSIPDLLLRRAPLWDWMVYYYIAFRYHFHNLSSNYIFKASLPYCPNCAGA
jgi:predicted RNase H-like HicB family nuclease